MAAKSKRLAREAAVQALYEIELGRPKPSDAIENAVMEREISHDLADYMQRLVNGVREHRRDLDARIARLVQGYDFDRLAAIDRNIMRLAAYELIHVPEMPPAVTINEAIEIAKKYSTAESGRFVNGVLGRLLEETPKANWDPKTAPPEAQEEIIREPAPKIEEEIVEAGSEEAKTASRFGWVLRSGDREVPKNTDQ